MSGNEETNQLLREIRDLLANSDKKNEERDKKYEERDKRYDDHLSIMERAYTGYLEDSKRLGAENERKNVDAWKRYNEATRKETIRQTIYLSICMFIIAVVAVAYASMGN